MADITMCEDRECPNFQRCYRAQAPANEYRQAYFMASPRDLEICRFYAPMEYSDGTSARHH